MSFESVCRTPKYIVDLCQRSLKNKERMIKNHFANEDGYLDYYNLDVTRLKIDDIFC